MQNPSLAHIANRNAHQRHRPIPSLEQEKTFSKYATFIHEIDQGFWRIEQILSIIWPITF